MAYKNLDNPKKQIKEATEQILKTLYGEIGGALIEFAPANKIQRLLSII